MIRYLCKEIFRCHPALTIVVALGVAALCMFLMFGCAVAQSPSGEYVLGIGVAKEPGSAADIGGTVGSLLSPWLGPIGGVIGTGLGATLTAFGIGGRKRAADSAWDESQAKALEAARARDAAFDEGLIYGRLGAVPPSSVGGVGNGAGSPGGAVPQGA